MFHTTDSIDSSIERLIQSNRLNAYHETQRGRRQRIDAATHRLLLEQDPHRDDIVYELPPTLQ